MKQPYDSLVKYLFSNKPMRSQKPAFIFQYSGVVLKEHKKSKGIRCLNFPEKLQMKSPLRIEERIIAKK